MSLIDTFIEDHEFPNWEGSDIPWVLKLHLPSIRSLLLSHQSTIWAINSLKVRHESNIASALNIMSLVHKVSFTHSFLHFFIRVIPLVVQISRLLIYHMVIFYWF